MTGTARAILLCGSAASFLAGLTVQARTGQGWGLIVLGVAIAASVLLEGRYRGATRSATGRAGWQRTGKREIDSETGQIVEVWFDPATGDRHYLPAPDQS